MKIKVEITGVIKEFELDDKFENKLEIILDLIESNLKLGKKFFNLEINDKLISSDFDLYDNCTINIKTKFGFFNSDFVKLKFNNLDHYLPSSLLAESNVIKVIFFDEKDEILSGDSLTFSNKKFKNTKCIGDWLNLSYEMDSYLSLLNKSNADLELPKPLTNKKLSEYIGLNAYHYLDALSREELDSLATLCDYLDISYLLETTCAFIAEKFIKNSSLDELKDFFDDIEIT